jgi:transposase
MSRKELFIDASEDDLNALRRIFIYHESSRARQRAGMIIMLAKKKSMTDVSIIFGVNYRTVQTTRKKWIKSGFESLVDAPRSGGPLKTTEDQRKYIIDYAKSKPSTSKELLVQHIENGGREVHSNTIKNILKFAGMAWKRTRHSLKKKRDPVRYEEAKVDIGKLRDRAAKNEIVLAYVDEVGFSQIHPNRSAWTSVGDCHLIEATRGKRLNLLGAILSTGKFLAYKFWQTCDQDLFKCFLDKLKDIRYELQKPLYIILDNASIHTSKVVKEMANFLKAHDVHLYFLPPYSPELNRIEKLWHQIKYSWMDVKKRDAETLEQDVEDIIQGYGSKYKFSF